MDRKDFLNSVGMSAVAFALINCIGCKNSRFYCPNHGATFSENGVVTNGPASHSLTVYNTQLTGTTLKVYS